MNELTYFLIDYKTPLQLVHLLGVMIALSGAVMSDTTFFDSVEDSTITSDEIRHIKRSGRIVICGLSIIIISGVFIFLSDVDKYIHSAKFLAKMSIVAILTANGFLFHLRHIPWLSRVVGTDIRTQPDFRNKRVELILSGAVSIASWISAVVLGTLASLPLSFVTIMTVYIVFIGFTSIVTIVIRKQLI
jgi:hypothetical protein